MTIATVLPVLGLALLLVARAQLASSLSVRPSAIYFDAALFCIVLACVLLFFYASLNILSGTWEDTEGWRGWAVTTTVWAASVLFGVPLANLLLLAFRRPFLSKEGRYYYRKITRSVRENTRDADKTRKTLFRQYAKMTAILDERAVGLREAPFDPAQTVADAAQAREDLVGMARLVEHTIAESEAKRYEIRKTLVDMRSEYRDMVVEIRRSFGQSMWNLFSASIGHAEPADVSDDRTDRKDSTPKLIVARPAPRPDDPPR